MGGERGEGCLFFGGDDASCTQTATVHVASNPWWSVPLGVGPLRGSALYSPDRNRKAQAH